MQVERHVAAGADQLRGAKTAVVGGDVAGQVTIFRHAAAGALAEGGSFFGDGRAFFVTGFVFPNLFVVLGVGQVRVEARADVVRDLGVFGLDLDGSHPGVFGEIGGDGD